MIATHLGVCHNELIDVSLCLHHHPSKLLVTTTSHPVHHPLQNIKACSVHGQSIVTRCLGFKNVQKASAVLQWMAHLAQDRQFKQHTSQKAQGFQHHTIPCCTDGHMSWLELDYNQTHTLKTVSIRLLAMSSAASYIRCGRCAMLATRLRNALANSSGAAASALLCPRLAKV